jgi:3-hydroxyisobutyrate dehydrogenase-like beta-hydroxyacid dehydrogenase
VIRVGFAGIGKMGLPMARNLLRAGVPLSVYNRTSERCAPLLAEGASLAGTPAELAREADVVVTMVADGPAVRAILHGPDGLLAGASPGLVLVEMSTIGPTAARELAEHAAASEVRMIDSPVSGSVSVAEAGELTAMVGGAEEAVETARPILEAMTKAQFHLGPTGAGAAMKLAVNVIIASTAHAVSEALVLAESAGIEREDAYEVIATSAVSSPFVGYKREAFLDPEGTPPAFALDLMRKDLALALDLGASARLPLLAAAAASEATTLAAGLEGGDQDLVRIADALRRISANGSAEEKR